MKKTILLLLFVLLSGCNYEKPLKDNYSNTIVLSTGDIIYITGMKNYEEVRFSPNITGDREIFQKLKSQGKICSEKSYGIGGGSDGCNNITGYIHTYTIPKLGLQIEAYQNAMVDTNDNPGIFNSRIQQPFVLSGSLIKEIRQSGINSEEYILQYHDMHNSSTIEEIIADDTKLLGYTGDINLVDTGIYNIFYQIGGEYFLKNYYFQTGKNYYYIYITPGSSCTPGPCGMDRHKFTYFLK